MAWLQLRVNSAHPEFVEEVLLAHGASAISMVDAEDCPVLEPGPGETPLWPHTVTLGLFPENTELAPVIADLKELLPDGPEARFETELIEDQDWVRVWLKDCPPLKFGERLWVVPQAKLGEVTDPDAVILKLDPGLAFGTGTHPTTALCLEWLAGQDLRGKTVLDFGCGSGILAIAALLLGAERAVGVDIDPQALTATADNARENGVGDRITTFLPQDFEPQYADVVLANILANPLIALAPQLAANVRKGGSLVLAGLLDRQADEVRDAYRDWFDFAPDVRREGWTRLTGHCRLPALLNLRRIDERIATAGQPQREHFGVLAQAGFRAVINLAQPTSPNALPDEAELCAAAGLGYEALPIPFSAPSPEHYAAFRAMMQTLGEQRVLVHCALNYRASAFLFLYRVLERGEDRARAQAELHAVWTPNAVWQDFIDRMLQSGGAG